VGVIDRAPLDEIDEAICDACPPTCCRGKLWAMIESHFAKICPTCSARWYRTHKHSFAISGRELLTAVEVGR
jgi:hypothetical protein